MPIDPIIKADAYHPVGYKQVAAAIVLQAVADWRWLCEGNEESRDCCFYELTRFFKNEAHDYLICSNIKAEEILTLLLKEKRESNYIKKRDAKRMSKRLKVLWKVKWAM